MSSVTAAIVGSGNIGTDLMEKLRRSTGIELRYVIGVDPGSDGLKRAAKAGFEVSSGGIDWLLERDELPRIVFEATSAYVHVRNAPRYRAADIAAVDLTPAARGPFVVPPVNLASMLDDRGAEAINVNMVTCGGQATIPIVHAVSRITPVRYAEIVATIASASAGPGTRANIDEFTVTTSEAIRTVGGAAAAKAIIILNPAEPPLMMRDTVICEIGRDADRAAVEASIREMVAAVAGYVPGYRLRAEPQFSEDRVTVFLEVEGAGDYLAPYAGNLDIMTAAAARVGEEIAAWLLSTEGSTR